MARARRILHIDMDAYFAALEAQACPSLAGVPLVVGALPGSRGVVASASYEARAFGIRAGMPVAQAQRMAPQVQFVSCHPSLYIHTSRLILKHLLETTSQVEMFSIDEAYLDITDLLSRDPADPASWKQIEALAHEISGSIERRFCLTCSVGAGPNKLIAKMASKVKKPRGVTLLGNDCFRRRFWSKPVEVLYGVGKKTASSLMIFGIETIGELAEASVEFLQRHFGLYGTALHAMAWGQDESSIVPSHAAPPAKSLGHEHTLQSDLHSPAEGEALLLALADRVGEDLRCEGYAGRRVAIRVRHSDFSNLTRQRMLEGPTQETRDIYRGARDLFRANYCGDGIRLLGITVGDLIPTRGREQLKLFPEDRRYRDLLATLDRIRDQYGRCSIFPAGALRQVRHRGQGITPRVTRRHGAHVPAPPPAASIPTGRRDDHAPEA
ncbi:MAG: DNA polymerase IV [Candidatus Eisenbacteria sp.]|nr:DNA polymerase IV [Candidatus Eisenbacteria bacterium]